MSDGAITLGLFNSLFASVAEEMGAVLSRTGFSANIKERQDYSCAVFDGDGRLVAQAAHLPVHLGSMPASVAAAIRNLEMFPGDVAILNDPFLGGTHLPDVTLVAPAYEGGELIGYVANRAHHADIGGSSPGSMPLSTEIYQEGLIIPPIKLVEDGVVDSKVVELLCRNVRTPDERRGDLAAQISAIRVGVSRVSEMTLKHGIQQVRMQMRRLIEYGEVLTRDTIRGIPIGRYEFTDVLDDDGISGDAVVIRAEIIIKDDSLTVDFSGTSPASAGPVNTVVAVAESALLYVVRCLMCGEGPTNAGCMVPLRLIAPANTVVSAEPPHAVSAGNVETSQRIVDVLLGALAQALPDVVPAASQGTMNNLAFGGYDSRHKRAFAYYETIGGGMGARPGADGLSAVQTHMTNTLNTPVEALEFEMPVRVIEYAVRRGSGGSGRHRGGDGTRRVLRFLVATDFTVISDRRRHPPYGLQGGRPGALGRNALIRSGSAQIKELPSKTRLILEPGDTVVIESPGGGGWGAQGD